jgi:DNA-binding transcriptional LysR family regulator
MDTRQLRYFLAVVDHQGLSRAAEHLYIAQPSLSQAIATLERDLGIVLFHRIGRRLILSEAGERLVSPARQVLRDLAAAHSTIDALKGLNTGRVEMITMPSPGIEPLSTLMRRFAELYPKVTMSIDAAFLPEEVIHAVRSGACEIGLLGAPTVIQSPDLDVIQLEDQALVLVTASHRPLPAARVIFREDLAGHRLVVSQRGSLMRQLVDDVLASGVDANIVAEVAHRTSILPLVLSGFANAVLPASWAPLARLAGAQVVRIEPASHLRVALVARSAELTPAARAFQEAARQYAAEQRPNWEDA